MDSTLLTMLQLAAPLWDVRARYGLTVQIHP
jgi:hypothetical protein